MTIVPPSYADDGLLQATTSVKNQRYDTDTIVYPTEIRIPASTHSATCLPEPAYVPQGWTPHINPEGAPYWVNTLPTICIVTDAPMHKRDVYEKVLASTEMIQDFAERLDFKWPKNSELYVRPQEGNDGCAYYIVDHDYQTELWLQDMDTQVLDIPDASSMDHLRFALQEHYWHHVTLFPHRPVSPHLYQELVKIMRHGQTDHLTSESSHFPYNADMCEKFVKILDGKYDTDPYTTWIAARLWNAIALHRFTQFHGEDHARLHRFQRRCEVPLVVNNAMMRLCSRLLFGMPTDIQESLGRLYIDRVTYDMHWRTFISAQICGWRESAYLAAALLVAVSASTTKSGNVVYRCTGLISAVLALGSLTASIILMHLYSRAGEYNANTASGHMDEIEHENLGFWPVALAYSLPKALLYWTVASLAVHFLVAVT